MFGKIIFQGDVNRTGKWLRPILGIPSRSRGEAKGRIKSRVPKAMVADSQVLLGSGGRPRPKCPQ
jgi:hypothetical protein